MVVPVMFYKIQPKLDIQCTPVAPPSSLEDLWLLADFVEHYRVW
jgi:hypothetical protein